MEELGEELGDIKREIIESRGLVIKTNHLTNALAADLKSIGRRQQNSERKAFWNSAAANLLVLVVVVVSVKLAWDARVDFVERELRGAASEISTLQEQLKVAQAGAAMKKRGEAAAATFYGLIRSGKKTEFIERYEALQKERLSRAEAAYFRDAVDEARLEVSVTAFHQGMEHMRAARWHESVVALEESLRYQPRASHSPRATLSLASSYRELDRQRDAVPILLKLSEASSDTRLRAEATWLLARCFIDLGTYSRAKSTLVSLLQRYPASKYISRAKKALHTIGNKR